MMDKWMHIESEPLYANEKTKTILVILFNCCHLVDKTEIQNPTYAQSTLFFAPLMYVFPTETISLSETYQHIIGLVPFLKGYSNLKWKFGHQSLTPCRSKPVKASFVFGTQFKIFWNKNREACNCPIDCQVNNTVKFQKSMKNIVKIIHLPSVV